MDAAWAEGSLNETYLELDRSAGLDPAKTHEVDTARADVLGDQGDGYGFALTGHALQAQGQAQDRSRVRTAVFRHTNHMRRHAGETARLVFRNRADCRRQVF